MTEGLFSLAGGIQNDPQPLDNRPLAHHVVQPLRPELLIKTILVVATAEQWPAWKAPPRWRSLRPFAV